MLSLNKVSVLVSVLFTAVQVNAQDLVAFTGILATETHSFEITLATDVCVTLWEGQDCTREPFNFGRKHHGACIDVTCGISSAGSKR
ncbi:hypothetical protein B0H13DRAFT_2320913 [Mycena leptocephala]|nr:hypothetical protein B0H13DRAFT_2320913 [Mycena leptocephala]